MTESEQHNFDRIVRETQVRIRAYIAGMGIASHAVDDVAQDVYIELYRCIDRMPPGVSVERWLKGIARNLCLNYIRKISRRGRLHREALAELLHHAKCDLEDKSIHPEVEHALDGCCEKLPERSRKILLLRYTEDLASHNIADVLNTTAQAVRVALHRIRNQLRDCIAKKLAKET